MILSEVRPPRWPSRVAPLHARGIGASTPPALARPCNGAELHGAQRRKRAGLLEGAGTCAIQAHHHGTDVVAATKASGQK